MIAARPKPMFSLPAAALARAGRVLPKGPADLARQIALLLAFDVAYEISRVVATGQRGVALAHAHAIVHAEQSAGIFHELDVQRVAREVPALMALANWTYFACQLFVSFAFLGWVYLRRNGAYPRVRNVMLTADALGLAGYLLYPAAPPRMLSGLGFTDTLHATAVNHQSSAIEAFSNPYAAMPSLHTAWASIVGISAVLLVRRPVLRALWALYPGLVVFSIVATANHFLLDAIAGASVAALAAGIVLAPRRTAALGAAGLGVFALVRVGGTLGDAWGALDGAALGLLVLALLANLASVWGKAAVWKRALESLPEGRELGYRAIVPPLFIGFLFNAALVARMGEVARVLVLRRRAAALGRPIGAAAIAGTVVAENVVLAAALALVGAVLALSVVDVPAWAIATLAALAGTALLMAAATAAGGTVERLPFVGTHAGGALRAGRSLLGRPRAAAESLALGVLSWLAQLAGIAWTLDAFGLPHGAAAAGAVFMASTLAGIVPLVPGNVGVFQVAVVAALLPLGVRPGEAAAFGVGLQAVELALGAGLGAAFLAAERLSFTDLRGQLRATAPAPANDHRVAACVRAR